MIKYSLTVLAFLTFGTATADVQVKFVESAPRDRFIVKNTGACELQALRLEIDLTDSAGKLIFDTTAAGAGVEVFQPFRAADGKLALQGSVGDGDTRIQVQIGTLASGEQTSFTIDVDDTLTNSALGNIRVAGSEIKSGRVVLGIGQTSAVAQFGEDALATLELPACQGS